MFSQSEHVVSDATVRIQLASGVLTPASDNSLNLSDDISYGGKKRKRDGNTMNDLLNDTFVVRPYPSSGSVKSRTFQPLLLLPRSNLPLSAIDVASSAKSLPQSRLFESHVKILELEDRMGSQPLVLIAGLEGTHTLFALERESRGLYALFQLGSWINLEQLRGVAVASTQVIPKPSGSVYPSEASVPPMIPENNRYSKKKRLAIELIQSMVKRPPPNIVPEFPNADLESSTTNVSVEATTSEITLPKTDTPPVVDQIQAQPTGAEIVDSVRNQYLEALYLSKASLAYFAKGPLSRARAAFHLDYDSTLDMNQYISFLEGLVLSTSLIDKKFRDGIPNCIALVDINDHSGEEITSSAVKPKKRKISKKMKLGKNGLYPTEEPLIHKWWRAHDDDVESGGPGSTREELTKNRISQLRIRETQLQMIIILEVLALQPLVAASEDTGLGLPSNSPSIESVAAICKPTKGKKPDLLSTLIDVHIDRLCIWQSVALESSKAPEALNSVTGQAEQLRHTDNIPRDFCVEVIAPFFSARLPDQCAIINRKLGGPVSSSQPKPKLSKSASFSNAPSKPGAATKRPLPVKPREPRTLQRVLSDDRERRSMSQGSNKKIALMRSATMPSSTVMKRETSEAPSLSSIPVADSQTFTTNRGGLLNSKRFAQREVDMSSLLPEMNPKARQKAIVAAELKDAISALKRPNRELAGKSIVETAEQRSSAINSRKSKKPVRNPMFQSVQITATPKAVRRKDAHFDVQDSSSKRRMQSAESPFVPASSLPSVPQSQARLSQHAAPDRTTMFSSIQATPTRKTSSRTGDVGKFDGFPPSSPCSVRRSSAQLFAVPDSAMKAKPSMLEGIQETPVKKQLESVLDQSHAVSLNNRADKENERDAMLPLSSRTEHVLAIEDESIYKSLGWDDDNDIDDLA